MRKKLTMKKSKSITFKDGCDEYINYCKARNLREGTIKHYRESIKTLYKFISEDTPINELNKKAFDNFVIDCKRTSNIKDTTLYTYTRDLKTLMYYFMKCGYIPTFKITLIKADKEPIECYSDVELKVLLKKPNIKECSFSEYKSWVIVNFLLSTGIRMNSLVNIQIKDLDFDNDVVYIRVTKNRKQLIIPLNCTIKKILLDYLNVRQHSSNEEYLFCNVYGNKLVKSTLYGGLVDYNKKRGIMKTGIHRYRHTFAKKWVISGGSIVTLQKILGHSSLAITENYLNILTTDIKKEIDKFNILDEFNNQYLKMNK
ncbi:tyrosine-type recombinase/integrase [Clostridium thermobutyricum]|uniref:tyrosine-type recombinase/integrase n=1 Tax=Clostridium thermobutyricum TaxID=29372 RepID=UPI0018AAEDE0|nr:tyrosine-type recombinase/integrase [Clostridium thermobutyricum]